MISILTNTLVLCKSFVTILQQVLGKFGVHRYCGSLSFIVCYDYVLKRTCDFVGGVLAPYVHKAHRLPNLVGHKLSN